MEYCSLPGIMALIIALLLGRTIQPDAPTDSQTSTEPCTITTEQVGSVTVRVGPGEYRGVLQFLPDNQTIHVIGQTTDDSGAVWWKIELAGVAEAWVAAADVESAGGCEVVLDAEAPPVVLPSNQNPPAESGTVYFPVYNCVYQGGGIFEWYTAEVTYDEAGNITAENILEGPFTGEFQPTCPPADGGSDGNNGGGNPTAVPPAATPVPTPGGSFSSGTNG